MPDPFDVVVIGGGHNGLVAAGLLAKQGARVVVLERRSQVGGAAITEQPWGADYRVTALSYVVSLMPPTILRELDLARHGYHVFPQGGYFVPHRDGRALQLTPESIGQFSHRDVDAYPRWEAWLAGLADVLGPLLTTIPPALGSRRPGDLLDQSQLAWKLRKLGVTGVAEHDEAVHLEHRRLARRLVRIATDARRALGQRRHRYVGRTTLGRHRIRDGAPQDR